MTLVIALKVLLPVMISSPVKLTKLLTTGPCMFMTSFIADRKIPLLPVNALTVVPFSTGTLVVIAVRLFCFPLSVVDRLVLPRTIVGAVTVPVPPSSIIFELSRPSCWTFGL